MCSRYPDHKSLVGCGPTAWPSSTGHAVLNNQVGRKSHQKPKGVGIGVPSFILVSSGSLPQRDEICVLEHAMRGIRMQIARVASGPIQLVLSIPQCQGRRRGGVVVLRHAGARIRYSSVENAVNDVDDSRRSTSQINKKEPRWSQDVIRTGGATRKRPSPSMESFHH